MNSFQQFILTSKYISSQRRLFEFQRRFIYNKQFYLTYEDLYTRYLPLNSSRLRISQI